MAGRWENLAEQATHLAVSIFDSIGYAWMAEILTHVSEARSTFVWPGECDMGDMMAFGEQHLVRNVVIMRIHSMLSLNRSGLLRACALASNPLLTAL